VKSRRESAVVRRSVAVPRRIVDEAVGAAGPALRDNFNRLVVVALSEYAERRRRYAFEQSMAEMAADPGIKYECKAVSAEFEKTESDGLKEG